MKLVAKRIYADADPADGKRILIDRLWPRGITKDRAAVDYWAKDIAPSNELRRWYQHDPAKWEMFQERYFAELLLQEAGVGRLRRELSDGLNTILFSSREEQLNNATALILFLQSS